MMILFAFFTLFFKALTKLNQWAEIINELKKTYLEMQYYSLKQFINVCFNKYLKKRQSNIKIPSPVAPIVHVLEHIIFAKKTERLWVCSRMYKKIIGVCHSIKKHNFHSSIVFQYVVVVSFRSRFN